MEDNADTELTPLEIQAEKALVILENRLKKQDILKKIFSAGFLRM